MLKMFSVITGITLLSLCCKESSTIKLGKDYPYYGGNYAGNRYSPIKQIDTLNVQRLAVAWKYNTTDSLTRRARKNECQPIVIDGMLYGTTPDLKLFALDAATGQQLWMFDPATVLQGYYALNRGVNYWQDGDDKRLFYAAGANLYAINATNGKPIIEFGENGKVDLHTGLSTDYYDASKLFVTSTSPGVIYKDILVIGSTVSEGGDALPGYIRGFNVRTGKLVWVFHTIPRPGEPGYETWPQDAYKKVGGANNWSGMVLDEKSGTVFLGTGSPSPNFYGGNRAGKNLYANCILALNAESGNLKWHFQTIAHDLWDLDIPCPPNLVTIVRDGKRIEAVAQTTKDGYVYVLDRKTGNSIFPINERRVRTDGVKGEVPYPMQKFPTKPTPFIRQIITMDDAPDSNYFPNSYSLFEQVFNESGTGSQYIPPSIKGFITIGISGGAEWGGSASDPQGILYQNASEVPWIIKLTDIKSNINRRMSRGNVLYLANCSACHGKDGKGNGPGFPDLNRIEAKLSRSQIGAILLNGAGRMPSFKTLPEEDRIAIVNYLINPNEKTDVSKTSVVKQKPESDFPYVEPFVSSNRKFYDTAGYPAIRPPWGTMNAIDLNTGEYLWRVPLGEYEALTKRGIPVTGTENNSGGPLVTAGGLIFIAATLDEKIRAFDKRNGKILWEYKLPAGGFATPISYEAKGVQYIVIAVSGGRTGKPPGQYIAFALGR